jgi:hypothetical protein
VLLFASLLIFLSALPRIVPLGMIFQADWMDPFFLVLIITVIHLKFVERGVLPLGSTRWTFAMPEGCSSSSRSSMAYSSSSTMLGEVALLDLLACGVFLFLGGTTHL